MWFALRLTTTLVFSESFCKLVTQKKQSEVIIYFEIGRNQPKMDVVLLFTYNVGLFIIEIDSLTSTTLQ